MLKSRCTRWRSLAPDARGTEIVESALVLPLVFMFVMAIFWFGQAFRIYGTLTHAAREGARAAVASVCTTCAAGNTPEQNAVTAVSNDMAAAHLSTAQLQPLASWTPPALCPCGTGPGCGTPRACDGAPSINVCVQENVQLSYPSVGGAGTCGTSVSMRYRYPYHFSIPLTPLDIGNVLLPGQAQMRVESQ
ncbi:MAG: TadE family protein [Candidatus Sulfotelmatobacter sp.]|jgi:hypothetical protein